MKLTIRAALATLLMVEDVDRFDNTIRMKYSYAAETTTSLLLKQEALVVGG